MRVENKMRMWMVSPKIMCRKHLLGEHVECHMLLSVLRIGNSIKGYIRNNCVEPHSIKIRHDQLAQEMINRKYNHKSPMVLNQNEPDCFVNVIVDKEKALQLLLNRCSNCIK